MSNNDDWLYKPMKLEVENVRMVGRLQKTREEVVRESTKELAFDKV